MVRLGEGYGEPSLSSLLTTIRSSPSENVLFESVYVQKKRYSTLHPPAGANEAEEKNMLLLQDRVLS
jgi:hypothetical protein